MAFGIPGINSPSLASATVQGANLMHQLGLPDPGNPTVSSPTSAASAKPVQALTMQTSFVTPGPSRL